MSYVSVNFGIQLKCVRESLGYTQKALADKIGIRQRDVSLLENGKSNPSLEMIERIVNGLGTTITIKIDKF